MSLVGEQCQALFGLQGIFRFGIFQTRAYHCYKTLLLLQTLGKGAAE